MPDKGLSDVVDRLDVEMKDDEEVHMPATGNCKRELPPL